MKIFCWEQKKNKSKTIQRFFVLFTKNIWKSFREFRRVRWYFFRDFIVVNALKMADVIKWLDNAEVFRHNIGFHANFLFYSQVIDLLAFCFL